MKKKKVKKTKRKPRATLEEKINVILQSNLRLEQEMREIIHRICRLEKIPVTTCE